MVKTKTMPKIDFSNASDEQLATEARTAPEIYNFLAARYIRPLRQFIYYSFIQDSQVAQDITQEALIRAYLNLDKFDPTRKWKTWLYTIAINCFYNLNRTPKIEALEFYSNTILAENLPEETTDRQLQKEKLIAAMSELPHGLGQILELYYFEELSCVEIAKQLDLPSGVIKSKLERAKKQLALLLSLEMDH